VDFNQEDERPEPAFERCSGLGESYACRLSAWFGAMLLGLVFVTLNLISLLR
jgi:hypothetical protein